MDQEPGEGEPGEGEPGEGEPGENRGLGEGGDGDRRPGRRPRGTPLRSGPRPVVLSLLGALVVVVGGLAGLVALSWPRVALAVGRDGLATVKVGGRGDRLAVATITFGRRSVPLSDRAGRLEPTAPLPQGRVGVVTVTVRDPSWLAFLAGRERVAHLRLTTPIARPSPTTLVSAPGGTLEVDFTSGVRVVEWREAGESRRLTLRHPTRRLRLGTAGASGATGSVVVEAAPEPWEALSAPTTLRYFVGSGPMLRATPLPGTIEPTSRNLVTLCFSGPVGDLLGSRHPTVRGISARWVAAGANRLVLRASSEGVWPGNHFTIQLPRQLGLVGTGRGEQQVQTLSYSLPAGSVLRLQQMLAVLHYLPLRWMPAAGQPVATTTSSALAAAFRPPAGRFSWRFPTTPTRLERLWQPGVDSVLTDGAILDFEHVEGLAPVGVANPLLWPYLVQAYLLDESDPHGYSWLDVSTAAPREVLLWRNGRVLLTAPLDPRAGPSPIGSWPVEGRASLEAVPVTAADGTVSTGEVHWVDLYDHGAAIYGLRAPSTTAEPDRRGVALSEENAALIWPHLHLGTIISVHR